jgi:RNA polymerase sigma factor (TIGR02999 family)
MTKISTILKATQQGDPQSATQLLPLVYTELRKLAVQQMRRQSPGQTLQPTALVHDAWLRVSGPARRNFKNRAHFFAAAAQAMRHILIDNARRKKALRHGGGYVRLDIQEIPNAAPATDEQLLALDETLNKLAREDARKAKLVELRYFVGLSVEEAAKVLEISVPTAKRDWAYAKAFLYQEMKGESRQLGTSA